ncbi:MAG: cytochrome c biogenesis protein CcsA [Planctomycetes bacterium]|nr:cytochrome c biogenesis protein CcsA [Planctomycetota bacterium]MBI3847747.1 cytochrome c biogenesis protein CcsA [Planctomycetota bacterium]
MKALFRSVGIPILSILFALDIWMIFFYAPMEKELQASQKIFYFHVAAAMTAFLAFTVAFVCGIGWYVRKREVWDDVQVASVEVGLVFSAIVLATGPIWARTAWNTWWTWDPRLVTMTILFLCYVGYLVVRASLSGDARKNACAAMAILFGINIPITWLSIQWWRTIHPDIGGLPGTRLEPKMRIAFWFSVLLFILLFIPLVAIRSRMERAAKALRALHRERLFGGTE